MKGKLLTTAIVASWLVAGSAYATIARQAVLGNQPLATFNGAGVSSSLATGALWYDDDYNVFYNPSYVMDNKNYVVVQKGLEGGFFKGEFENFAYGVYLNRGGTTAGPQTVYAPGMVSPGLKQQNQYTGAGATALNTQRPIDLFFAGDTGVKWGLHLAWAYNRNQTVATKANDGGEVTNRYWHADFGMQMMGLEPFIGLTFASDYQDNSGATTTPYTQSLNEFNAGVRYKYEGWTPYFAFKKFRDGGVNNGAGTTQIQSRVNQWALGVGHDTKVADGVHVLKNIGVFINSYEDDAPAAEANRDYKETIVPINVAIEGEATSWLTLRAGASFDLFNQQSYARSNRNPDVSVNDKVKSLAGTTSFRVGSTFKFGKLHMDSAFGVGAAAADGSSTQNGLDGSNFGFDAQTFALVSVGYHW